MKKIIILVILFLASIAWVVHKKNESDAHKKSIAVVEKQEVIVDAVQDIQEVDVEIRPVKEIKNLKQINEVSAVLAGTEIPELDFDGNEDLVINKKVLVLFNYFFKAKDELAKPKIITHLKQHIQQQPEPAQVQLNDILNRFIAFNEGVSKIEYSADENASAENKIKQLSQYMLQVNELRMKHYGEDLASQLYSDSENK